MCVVKLQTRKYVISQIKICSDAVAAVEKYFYFLIYYCIKQPPFEKKTDKFSKFFIKCH